MDFSAHSLGGSISEIMSVKTGCSAVTFNPYGVSQIPEIKKNTGNADVINYGNFGDLIFRSNMYNNIGEIRVIIDGSSIKKESKSYYIYYSLEGIKEKKFNDKHLLENMGDLKNSVDLKDIKLPNSTDNKNLIKIRISKDMYKDENGHWVTIDGRHVFIKD